MGFSGLALMFGGNLSGRVSRCYDAPPGLKRRGKTIKKLCLPRQYNKRVGKGGGAVSLAYVKQVGKSPKHLIAYQPSNLSPEAASKAIGRITAKGLPRTRGAMPKESNEYILEVVKSPKRAKALTAKSKAATKRKSTKSRSTAKRKPAKRKKGKKRSKAKRKK